MFKGQPALSFDNESNVEKMFPLHFFDPKKFWEENEGEIHRNIEAMFPRPKFADDSNSLLRRETLKEIMAASLNKTEFSPQELIDYAIKERAKKEYEFSKLAHETTEKALDSHGNLIVLFDLDHTLCQCDAEEVLLRPAIMPLFKNFFGKLKQTGVIEIGALSSRAQESMMRLFSGSTGMSSLFEYLSPDRIYSSRNECSKEIQNGFHDFIPWTILKEKYGGNDGILDDVALDQTPEWIKARTVSTDDLQKPSVLQKIHYANSDKGIVIFDDVRYPDYLKSDCGIYGASVKDCDFRCY